MTALATKGIGASLQHYNPIVDESTASQFDIPNTWKLIAQMPFGDVRESANEKEIKPVEDRFIIKNNLINCVCVGITQTLFAFNT